MKIISTQWGMNIGTQFTIIMHLSRGMNSGTQFTIIMHLSTNLADLSAVKISHAFFHAKVRK